MRTVLLTGATTGIGLAVARLLLPRTDHRLVLTARAGSLGRFAELGIEETDRVHLRPLDVTVKAERMTVVEECDGRWGGVDVLINNAGLSYRAVVEHVTEEERLEQMGINFRGPMGLARIVLPRMRHKRAGRIINVSSVGGMMAMPTMAIYSASKFALEGATEALYYEVKPFGIQVSLVEPGFINSGGFRNTHYTGLACAAENDPANPYNAHYTHMVRFVTWLMTHSLSTAESVARRIVKTMDRRWPPLRVAGTPDAHLFGLMRRFLPRRFYHWALYKSLPGVREWGRR